MNKNDKQAHRDAVAAQGIKKHPIGQAVRKKCFECQAGSWKKVRNCEDTDCALWPFRLGFNPFSTRGNSKNSKLQGYNNINQAQQSAKGYRIIGGVNKKQGVGGHTEAGHVFHGEQGQFLGSENREKIHVPAVQKAIMEFVAERRKHSDRFTGADIERVFVVGKFHLGSYKTRELRKLNKIYQFYQVIDKQHALYRITKSRRELKIIVDSLTIY